MRRPFEALVLLRGRSEAQVRAGSRDLPLRALQDALPAQPGGGTPDRNVGLVKEKTASESPQTFWSCSDAVRPLSSWAPASGHPGTCYFVPFLVRFRVRSPYTKNAG